MEKILFQAKKRQKTRFLGFSYITALNRFAFLLYCFDDAQTYKVVAQLDVQGVPIIKGASLNGKNFVSSQKTSKKRVFWGFHTLLH